MFNLSSDLVGKNALVCGGSQGIGLASAVQLAKMGAQVTLLARDVKKLEAATKLLNVDYQQNHQYLVADLSQTESLVEVVRQSGDQYHLLINNAGGPPAGPIVAAVEDEFLSAFRLHLLAHHTLMQALVPFMKSEGFGRIVNVISTSVKQPLKGLGVSNTIRAAVANWSKTLATELAPWGITVNNVLPGATMTERLSQIIANKALRSGLSEEVISKEMLDEIPAGRFAHPEEVAAAVAFLCSPAAAYITGINVPVDGGRTLCL